MIDAVGGGALLLLTGAAYLFVAEPAMEAQRRLEAERKASAESESRADQAAKDLSDAERQLAQLERELNTVAVELRTPAQINRQIDRLTMIAESSGVRLSRITPQSGWGNQWYTAVPISMSGSGTFTSAADFLRRVRTECADVSVRGLKIVGRTDAIAAAASATDNTAPGTPTTTSLEIEFVWYAAPEGTAAVPTTK